MVRHALCLRGTIVGMTALWIGACAQSAPDLVEQGIRFDRYHRVEEFQDYLTGVARDYPALVTLHEIGESRLGRPIMAIEINNPETGPANEKPGFYLDGNIHGGEVLGGEGALYFIDYLLTRYGNDSDITGLVDTRAFYIVPLVNPDGRAISVDTPENHRWNVRPTDEDGDGLLDEDPPEDLDGDGRILQMRVSDPDGGWKKSADDPRRMVRRGQDETEGSFYQLYSEGIDSDEDGRFNEDRVGGVDLNRNFPANWDPAQFASGPYPLSEPETHALVEYITSRPNIAAIHTFHTSGGLLLRFPTLADQDWDFPQADLEDYRVIAEAGVAITGYANFAYQKKTIVDLMNPGHGVFNDWGSKEFGVMAMTTEMWGHAIGEGQEALFAWNDRVLEGKGFVEWYAFDHPQLGPIELGGWDKWSIASPPEHLIQAELDRNVRWVVTFAERLPRLMILSTSAQPGSVPGIVQVTADIANMGWMPTATAHASEVLGIAKDVLVKISLTNAELTAGEAETSLGVLAGARQDGPDSRTLTWTMRTVDLSQEAKVDIEVWSEKGGVARRSVRLGGG